MDRSIDRYDNALCLYGYICMCVKKQDDSSRRGEGRGRKEC